MESREVGRAGVWLVTTESSRYLLDLDHHWVTRLPGDQAHGAGRQAVSLRGDGQPLQLVALAACRPGMPMLMLVVIREDGLVTVRRTTPVRAITPLPHPAAPVEDGDCDP